MPDLVREVIDEFVKNYQPEKVIIFGSTASGKMHCWSDIDIVAVKKTNQKFYERIDEASASVDHKIPLDILVYTPEEFEEMSKNNPFIKNEVLKKGQVVYG